MLSVFVFGLATTLACACASPIDDEAAASSESELTSDADFDVSTCGQGHLSAAQLLKVLGSKQVRTFDLTVRHRTRLCVTDGDPAAGTCGPWTPTVKIQHSAFSISIEAGRPVPFFDFPYRSIELKEVPSSASFTSPTPDLSNFYLTFADRELRSQGRVVAYDNSGLSNGRYGANPIADGVSAARGSGKCLWVKGSVLTHATSNYPDGRWNYNEQQIIYTAANYPAYELAP
jgi:hypothetical protein